MKKVKPPLICGNKIVSAYIQNDIKLFNRPDMWDYSGSIPAEEYYQPDTMHPTKRAEFKIWYTQQLQDEVRFDFQEEMQSYCHSDVELLRQGMSKFRDLFMSLKKPDGSAIGVDPFNYLTISGVAFDGIYLPHFLPRQTIGIVPRPPKSNYSIKQILWMEWEMKGTNQFIQHALNGGEMSIQLRRAKQLQLMVLMLLQTVFMNFTGIFIMDVQLIMNLVHKLHTECAKQQTIKERRATSVSNLVTCYQTLLQRQKASKKPATTLLKCGSVNGTIFLRSSIYQLLKKNSKVLNVLYLEMHILVVVPMQ